jgi:hypothetical protein
LLEIVLFSWVFGVKKGWTEIMNGSDIRIPSIYKFIIKWITPFMLLAVFLGSLIRPAGDEWSTVGLRGWKLHKESIIGQMLHLGIGPNSSYFTDKFYAEQDGVIDSVYISRDDHYISVAVTSGDGVTYVSYPYEKSHTLQVRPGDRVKTGDVLFTGRIVNKVFFIDISRFLLTSVFILIGIIVYIAYRKRKRNGELTF